MHGHKYKAKKHNINLTHKLQKQHGHHTHIYPLRLTYYEALKNSKSFKKKNFKLFIIEGVNVVTSKVPSLFLLA